MRRILEELYYGNINPNEKQFIRNTGYDKAMRTISESESKLTELLTGKEKDLFLKMPRRLQMYRPDIYFMVYWNQERGWRDDLHHGRYAWGFYPVQHG